jgi:hypothetical protein
MDRSDATPDNIITAEHIAAAFRAGACLPALEWAEAAQRTFADLWTECGEWAMWAWRVPELRDGLAASAPDDVRVVRSGNAAVRDGCCLCDGDARVVACGSASVFACGNAIVRAFDNSRVFACDNAIIHAQDYAIVYATASASADAYGNAHVWRDGKLVRS